MSVHLFETEEELRKHALRVTTDRAIVDAERMLVEAIEGRLPKIPLTPPLFRVSPGSPIPPDRVDAINRQCAAKYARDVRAAFSVERDKLCERLERQLVPVFRAAHRLGITLQPRRIVAVRKAVGPTR